MWPSSQRGGPRQLNAQPMDQWGRISSCVAEARDYVPARFEGPLRGLVPGIHRDMVVIASLAGNTSPWEAGLIGILNGAVFGSGINW